MSLPVRLDSNHLGAFSTNRTFEPQRQNNSLVFLTGLANKIAAGGFPSNPDAESVIALSVDSFPLPKQSNNIIEVPWNNMRIKFAGAMVFEDMDVTLKDFVDVETAVLLNQWRLVCANPANGAVGFASTYKLNNCFTVLYGPDGSLPRYYQMDGVWLSRLDSGDVDHASDDYMRMVATLTCDRIIPLLAVDNNATLMPNVGAGSGLTSITPPTGVVA